MRKVPASQIVREELDRILAEGAGPDANLVSEFVSLATRLVAQSLLESEQTDFLGGRGRYEVRDVTSNQVGSRNGYYDSAITTAEGKIPVRVPEVRGAGEPFRSVLMEFLDGNSDVLERLVAEMYARGLSNRDVEDALRDSTGELVLSKSAVFRGDRRVMGTI